MRTSKANFGTIDDQGIRHAAGFSGYTKPKRGADRKLQRDNGWSRHEGGEDHRQHEDANEVTRPVDSKPQHRYDTYKKNFNDNYSQLSHDRNRYKSSNNHRKNKDQYKAEKTPNLLTWSDKQQIRILNEQSPEQWTPERLSGVFPATFSTVKKILSNRWQPSDIGKHDAAVMKHWQQLQSGQFKDLEPALSLHLKKFIHGNQIQEEVKDQQVSQVKRTDEDVHEEEKSLQFNQDRNSASVVMQDSQLDVDKRIVPGLIPRTNKSVVKYKAKKVAPQEQKPSYPERITIPADKWKEGATYRVEDAYYHSDGTFLYRVPGMTK